MGDGSYCFCNGTRNAPMYCACPRYGGGGSSAVAQIGDNTYTSLIDAVNAAKEGDTIKLLQDYTIAADATANGNPTSYWLPKNAVLDLGSHTLQTQYQQPPAFEGEDITIQNGTVNCTGNYLYIGYGNVYSTVTVKNITTDAGVNVFCSDVTFEDCHIDASTARYYAVWADKGAPATIVIKSGTYISGKTAVVGTASKAQGEIDIYGGNFTFSNFVPSTDYDNVTVYAGTFTSSVPDTYFGKCSSQKALTSDGYSVSANHQSSLTEVEAKPSTCEELGYCAHWTCETCGANYSDKNGTTPINVTLPLGDHALTKVDAIAPTCTKDGQKAYWKCSVCESLFSDADGENEIGKPVVDPALGGEHTLVKTNEVAATCTEAGHKAYWTCSKCKALYSDENAKTQIDKPEAIAALGHTLTKTDEVAATCTTDGQKAYWTCSTCKKLFSDEAGKTEIKAPETIKALGHKLTKTDAVASTCKDKGHEAYWTCSTCKKLFSDAEGKTEIKAPKEFPLADHTYGDWTVTKAATETETGTKERTCKVCGKVETADVPKITPQAKQKVATDTLTNDDISDEMAKSGYDATDKIESALATTAAKTEGYTKENTTVSEVKLLISTDDGESWFEATEDNFPTEGLKVTLDYPEGTNSSYDFVVAHMFSTTSNKLGTKAGDIETPAVKKTKTGIQVTLKGLSPVSISWKRADPIVFIDVDSKTDHNEDINWLAATGVSTGWVEKDGTRTFRPYWNIARADMAAFLYRLAGSPEYTVPSKSPFVDCNENMAHYKEICWLAEMGISEGWTVKDGKEFRPYEPITRCDMAAFLYRLAGSPEYTVPSKSPFTDCTEKTDHYMEVCWLASTGVSEGWTVKGGKEFRAYSNVARADMAAFLHRMSEKGLVKDYE